MPRRLTRPEVVRRLAILAAHDAVPGITFSALAALFNASKRTVRDALRRSAAGWVAVLAAAPMPRHAGGRPSKGGAAALTLPVKPWEPGVRSKALLVPPEEDDDVEEQSPDVDVPEPMVNYEENPDVDIPEPKDPHDPADNPQPKLNREEKKDAG